jgi:hypothetical protein
LGGVSRLEVNRKLRRAGDVDHVGGIPIGKAHQAYDASVNAQCLKLISRTLGSSSRGNNRSQDETKRTS